MHEQHITGEWDEPDLRSGGSKRWSGRAEFDPGTGDVEPGSAEMFAQVRQIFGDALGGGLQNHRRTSGAADLCQQFRIDGALGEIRVPIRARIELVAGEIQMNQIYAAGGALIRSTPKVTVPEWNSWL